MKIVAICGSPRKGNTYFVLNDIQKSYPEIDFTILQLSDLNFETCRGCYVCVKRGEDKCPIKDDRGMIIGEILDADGIIVASPVYSHMIATPLKNLFERFGFYAHRPRFFDKYALSLVTCSGYGAQEALKYMDKMLSVFGFTLASPLELHFRPGKMPEKNIKRNHEKIIEAVDNFILLIEKGEKTKPSISMMIPFSIFKYVSEIDRENMTADYEYYKDKTDYYYKTKIPFYKKLIANKITKKIISEFE